MLRRLLAQLSGGYQTTSTQTLASASVRGISGIGDTTMSEGNAPETVEKTEGEWRAILSPQQVGFTVIISPSEAAQLMLGCWFQFRILREKGTEAAGTGKFDKFYEEGVYTCGACNTPLYKSSTKFKSGCGWPAFFDGTSMSHSSVRFHPSKLITSKAIPGAVNRHEDRSFGMTRTEITCAACGGHLGHVFKGEGFNTPSEYMRYSYTSPC